jgi:hypothetical protein
MIDRDARKRTYQSWSWMQSRCYNEKNPNYHNYGGRGIQICERWRLSFSAFLEDMGPRPIGLTIDRIDVNGDYCPENCRWADRAVQRRNQRGCIYLTLDGVTKTAEEWAADTGMNPETIRRRKKRGLSDEMALKTPNMARIPTRNWESHGLVGSATLSEQQIEEMLEQYIPGKRGHSIPSLAKQYGVSKSHVHRLIHGKAGPRRRNSRAGEAS